MADVVFYSLAFVDKLVEFESIYTFRFKPVDAIDFKAGQWAHLMIPTDVQDRSMVRHMSFASSPADPLIEFSMDVGSSTPFKKKMAELAPGDTVKLFKIKGEFVVDASVQTEVVFIAGGIGITPMRSIIRDLEQTRLSVPWSLLHVAHTEFLYENELTQFENTQYRVHRDGIDAVWNTLLNKPKDTRYYLSGSDNFVEGMRQKLNESGVQPTQIVIESFN